MPKGNGWIGRRCYELLLREPLSVRELAQRSGFSADTCRHALRRLRAQGAVVARGDARTWRRYQALAETQPLDRRGRPRAAR